MKRGDVSDYVATTLCALGYGLSDRLTKRERDFVEELSTRFAKHGVTPDQRERIEKILNSAMKRKRGRPG